MPRQVYGFWGFNRSSAVTIITDKKGIHWKARVTDKDAKDSKYHEHGGLAKNFEDAGLRAEAYLEKYMMNRPVLVHKSHYSPDYPSEVFTGEKAAKNFTMAFLAQQGEGQEHQLTPGGFHQN